MAALDPPRLEPISVRIPGAIRMTGMSRLRIFELMKSGDIEVVKVGGSTLILVENLRAFIQSRRAEAEPPSSRA